jgi:gliding motility-associated-like protein
MIIKLFRYLTVCLFLFLGTTHLYSQEICNNGIDDDGDGDIDLNDFDCECFSEVPSGLIPNPSFEEMSCCPSGESQLYCANDWIQASAATTDYLHTCGVTCHNFTNNCAPLPFPEGEGAIGFRDGSSSQGGLPNFKEYTGACLLDPLKAGVTYRLDFFAGFSDQISPSSTLDITIYATTDCGNLPFGGGDSNFGCPTNGPGWVELDNQLITGYDEWVNVVFEFTPIEDYTGIIIGPGCDINPDWQRNAYFFFDRLALAASEEFGIPLSEVTGSLCQNNLTLVFEDDPDYTYQWYKDGVAIPGETGKEITLANGPDVEGVYTVFIESSGGCIISSNYIVEVPEYESFISDEICLGDTYVNGDSTFTEEGFYEIPLIAEDGCDSIVFVNLSTVFYESSFADAFCEGTTYQLGSDSFDEEGLYAVDLISSEGCDSTVYLDLQMLENSFASRNDTICDGDFFFILDEEISDAGIYELNTINNVGCDSTITLTLEVLEAHEGVELGAPKELNLGEELNVNPTLFGNTVFFEWYNSLSEQLGNEANLSAYYPLENQWVYLEVVNDNGCPAIDSIEIRVNQDIDLYVPNIFSPNRDGQNDEFLALGNISVIGLESVFIYDRWGNLVFKDANQLTGRFNPIFKWDGRYQSKNVEQGVYTYIVEAKVINGTTIRKTGDVTLVR